MPVLWAAIAMFGKIKSVAPSAHKATAAYLFMGVVIRKKRRKGGWKIGSHVAGILTDDELHEGDV